jgi:hypothetical protein
VSLDEVEEKITSLEDLVQVRAVCVGGGMCVCVCMCMCARMCARAHFCVILDLVQVRACVCVDV